MTSDLALRQSKGSVSEVFQYFLKLGFLGFGGPLALIGIMQRELIEERGWMSEEEFSRAFALIKAMPGPVAFQTSTFLGRQRAGWKGGVAAVIGMNGPAFLMMVAFGIFYDRWRSASGAPAFMTGMQAASLGVIFSSIKNLAWGHRKKTTFWALAAIAMAATFAAPSFEPVVIVGFGALTAFLFSWRMKRMANPETARIVPAWLRDLRLAIAPVSAALHDPAAAVAAFLHQPNYPDLIWSCFKSGAFVFGSGLAIVPLMEHDFVSRLGWLTHQQFMDALAFGQITPGPVVITATFIGYRALGFWGAAAATAAIFGAPFFHMMTWFPRFVDRLAKLPWISAFLTGAIAAVVGSIFGTTLRLATTLDFKVVAVPLIVVSLGTALFTKVPVWILIPAGGLTGYLASFVL